MPAKSKANKACIANLNVAFQAQEMVQNMSKNSRIGDSVPKSLPKLALHVQDRSNFDKIEMDIDTIKHDDHDREKSNDYDKECGDIESESDDKDDKDEEAEQTALEMFMKMMTIAQQAAEEAE
ncbi:hypothetical protein BDQ17DRAFT_1326007 [Cyathus striatus]|nr:hypothetical protein BDQ17DRAFT_1326007 [Cyathus striatus]